MKQIWQIMVNKIKKNSKRNKKHLQIIRNCFVKDRVLSKMKDSSKKDSIPKLKLKISKMNFICSFKSSRRNFKRVRTVA